MASTKRDPPRDDSVEPEAKKAKANEAESSSVVQPKSQQRVVLNPADCNLDFYIEGNGLQGSALHEQGFAYCWSGARANVGITRGKYCFSCKIISAQPVDMEDTSLDQKHVCRLGISRRYDNVGNLGETENSFGFGGTAKFSNAGKFSQYGETFGVGDTILCAVNLEKQPLGFIGFSKNGKWLGTAKIFTAGPAPQGRGVFNLTTQSEFEKLQWESALFPHFLLKNVVVAVQFSLEDGLVPEEGYKPWASALEDGNAVMGPNFSKISDCKVMMMVGLPASGKSTWAEKWMKEHPEERYVLLGTNLALDQMKVPGLLRKNNYGERFDRLMDRATGIFNTLLSRAAKTPRNYILDQTNVYKSARKRKLKPFVYFRKIAVVVFPKPEELKSRADKRFKEMGKEVPAEAVNEMLAHFDLPMSVDMRDKDEYFDQVIFTELNREESQRCLDEMKRALAYGANVVPKSVSPSSRESSVQLRNSLAMQNQLTFSGNSPGVPVSCGYPQRSYSPLRPRNYDYQSPGQVNSAYFGGRPPRGVDSLSPANQGNQTPPLLNDPYRNYGGYESRTANPARMSTAQVNSAYFGGRPPRGVDSLPPANQGNQTPPLLNDPYHSYGGYESRTANPGLDTYQTYGVSGSYNRPNVGSRNVIHDPGLGTDPFQTYGVSGSYNHPNVESRNFIPGGGTNPYQSGMVEPYPRPGFPGPGVSQADLQASGQSTFVPGPLPTDGSPYYGTPIPVPRPPYGNLPSDMRQPQGYVRPRPSYYGP